MSVALMARFCDNQITIPVSCNRTWWVLIDFGVIQNFFTFQNCIRMHDKHGRRFSEEDNADVYDVSVSQQQRYFANHLQYLTILQKENKSREHSLVKPVLYKDAVYILSYILGS